jgi:hypothetical protein
MKVHNIIFALLYCFFNTGATFYNLFANFRLQFCLRRLIVHW